MSHVQRPQNHVFEVEHDPDVLDLEALLEAFAANGYHATHQA